MEALIVGIVAKEDLNATTKRQLITKLLNSSMKLSEDETNLVFTLASTYLQVFFIIFLSMFCYLFIYLLEIGMMWNIYNNTMLDSYQFQSNSQFN